MIRCIALPVATTTAFRDVPEVAWKDAMASLHQCWRESTDLANWAVQQCLRNDITRQPGDKKLARYPDWPTSGPKQLKGLYGLAAHTLDFSSPTSPWKGIAISASSLLRDVERKWRAVRFKVLWSGEMAPPVYRYPAPYPVHANCWTPHWDDGPVAVLKLASGLKVAFRLRAGSEFRRQLGHWKELVRTGKHAQCMITRQRDGGSHRRGTSERESGDRVRYRVMLRVPVEIKPREHDDTRVLTLCTDPDALWVAELDGRRAWVMNADHVQRAMAWQHAHELRRQRWAEDTKAERRGYRPKMEQFQASRERMCSKHARRMDSWCHEITAHLARFARRQHVGEVVYDDLKTSFMPSFPWYKMRTLLAQKLEQEGIKLITAASGEVVDETPDTAREEEGES